MISDIDVSFCKKVCTLLMNGKFICYYDKKDAELYRKINIVEHFCEIEERLDNVGFNLVHSERDKTIYVVSQEEYKHRKYNMTKLESIVLLFLIKRYFQEIKNVGINNVVFIKWNDFLSDIEDFLRSNTEKKKVIDALWVIKNSGVIDVNASKKELFTEDENEYINITIFPSINCILQYDKLQAIVDKIEEYMQKKENNNILEEEDDEE